MSAQQFPTEDTPRYLILMVTAVAVSLSLFQLWQPLVGFFPVGSLPFEKVLGQQPATYFRPIHLTWVLVLGFLVYPVAKGGGRSRLWDAVAIAVVLWASERVLGFDYQSIDHLLNGLNPEDFAAGLMLILLTLEMARRSVGPVMMWVGLVFFLYGAFGNLLPDVLATKGFSFERIVRFQVFTGAGLFGAPLGIAAGAVFSFVLFGAFLQDNRIKNSPAATIGIDKLCPIDSPILPGRKRI